MPPPSHNRLKTLDSVTGFGLFRDFAWDAARLDDFDRYNLVYGWNYSGKTTLSRTFQCLEDASLHPDFVGGAFQFTKGDGTTVSSSFVGPIPHVRVFNRHFVQRNFHVGLDMTGAKVIAVLGEANQTLKRRLADLEARSARLDTFCRKLRNEKGAIQQRIENEATNQARVVNGIVGGPYDRRHLNGTIDSLPRDRWPIPLAQNALDEKKEQFRKATDFSEVSLFSQDHRAVVRIVFKIRNSLLEVATNTAVNSLQNDHPLERWVQTGLGLNTVGAPCGFCGANILQSRWTELQGHFSDAFAALQTKLRGYRTLVESLKFDAPSLPETSVFPDLRGRFRSAQSVLCTSLDNARRAAEKVHTALDAKLERLEVGMEWQPDIETAKELRSSIRGYNAILADHNSRVAASDTVKEKAKRAICTHYAVEYLRDCKVVEQQKKMKTLEARVSDCTPIIGTISAKIATVKQAIRDASIGARRINESLAILLPGDNIEAVKLNDTDFQFQRGGLVARNMSEGERTAVAFSYFLTTLEEGAIPLEETIVVLDDPVSSLDSNHIYAIHSITENRLAKACQLFVLTHNSGFFGITKDWMTSRNGRFYMTQRTLGTTREWSSSLVRLPRMLKKFKSDYQYTYYCLKVINEDPAPQFENLCGVPNMIRCLLEAYLGFVFPEKAGWGEKLERIIPCKETCGRIKKFADENSHSHSLTQATEVPDYVAHCKGIVSAVLAALKTHNPAHVSSLEAEFSTEAGNLP